MKLSYECADPWSDYSAYRYNMREMKEKKVHRLGLNRDAEANGLDFIDVPLTQQHIDAGKPTADSCPIAFALNDAEIHGCKLSDAHVSFNNLHHWTRRLAPYAYMKCGDEPEKCVMFKGTPGVQRFMEDFDADPKSVSPRLLRLYIDEIHERQTPRLQGDVS